MSVKFYLVGGAVRDKLLGLRPKDLDYSCEAPSYEAMRDAIYNLGGQIFLETPEYYTIRAKVPKLGVADYVLCRREYGYKDGRHPDTVEVGTLYDDLARRDFTVNAMAEDEQGKVVDYFGGRGDLERGILRCVGDPYQRFSEDALRLLRAVRFAITKNFFLDESIEDCLRDGKLMDHLLYNVSVERKREEFLKCFKYNTPKTIEFLYNFPLLMGMFAGEGAMWLEPTLKER